jgi:hypothetical protein
MLETASHGAGSYLCGLPIPPLFLGNCNLPSVASQPGFPQETSFAKLAHLDVLLLLRQLFVDVNGNLVHNYRNLARSLSFA